MFTGIYDIAARDKTRDWNESRVKTAHFDATKQPVPSYQNPWELAQAVEVYCEMAPTRTLELGPYHGGTLWHWIANAPWNAKLGAVDWFDEKLGPRYATPEDWHQWAYDHSVQFKFIEGNTHDAGVHAQVREWYPDGIDWLFIDTTHDYPDVCQDFQDYGKLVVPGGVICIHDVRPRNMGTCKLFEEIRQAGYVTQLLVADPYSDDVDAGIGLVYV